MGKGASKTAEERAAEAAKKAEHEEAHERAQHMRQMAVEGGGTGGTTTIFRTNVGPNKQEEYLETVPTEQIWDEPHEYLKTKHGGGTYRCILKDSEKRFIPGMSHLKYNLAGPPILPTVETPETRKLDELQKQLDAALAAGNGAGATSSADMMRLMLEISREQLREVRNPPAAAAQGDPAQMAVNMMTAIQTAQAPLLAALIERASQPAPDVTAQLKGMVDMFGMLRELTGDNGGNRSGWDAIASKLADPLAGLVGQHVQNQQNGTAPPSTMGAPANPNPPRDPNVNRPPWLAFLEPYLPQLLNFAASGRDPQITADFFAEGIPDEHLGTIYEQLTRPTFMDELRAHVPETANNPEWFASFSARVLEWVVPPGNDDETPAPPEPGTAVAPVEVGTVARSDAPE